MLMILLISASYDAYGMLIIESANTVMRLLQLQRINSS